MRIHPWPLVGLLVTACVDDGKPGDDPIVVVETDGDTTDGGDTGGDGDAVRGRDGGADGGGGDASDAAPVDLGPDVFGGPWPVDDCEDACQRFVDCDRVGEVFGDHARCLDACAAASFDGPPQGFFDCVGVEPCGLLHLCRLPAPPALRCDEVCERALECGFEAPFDCVDQCEGNEQPWAECGERNRRACDVDGFWGCLGDELYVGCSRRCERAVACNIVREEDCLPDCLGEQFDEDPLRRRRAEQRNQCVARAPMDCVAVDTCLNPRGAPQSPRANLDTFCRLWNQCGFERDFPCELAWEDLEFSPGVGQCVVDSLSQGCPQDIFLVVELCFEGGGPPAGPGCVELCEARDLCDQLDDGEDRAACLQRCGAVLQGRDPEQIARQRLRFPCGVAGSCDELATCLQTTDPATACGEYCDALDACGAAAEGCAPACDDTFVRARAAAARTCVAEAGGDCDVIADCRPPPALPCDLQCQRMAACGDADPACEVVCDDAHYEDPDRAARLFACILTAPTCRGRFGEHSVDGCRGDPDVGGGACLGYCRATSDACDDGAGRDLAGCLAECGAGFGGDDALRFEAAGACLDRLRADADCDDVSACVPDEVVPDCDAWCGPLVGCALTDDGCGDRCGRDVLASLLAVRLGGCVTGADEDCDDVLECVEVTVAEGPAAPTVEAFCALYAQCDFFDEEIPCQFLWENLPSAREQRCAIEEVRRCPPFPFDIIDACFDGGGPAPPPPESPACERLCEARALCGDVGSARACALDCVDTFRQGGDAARVRVRASLPCAAALSCVELATCLEARTPEGQCARHCGQLAGCGLADDRDACVRDCDDVFVRGRQRAWLACTAGAGDDCGAIAACEPGPGVPCDDYCARLEQCGLAEGDCPSRCDDAHFDDPEASSIRVVCALTAPACVGPAEHNVAACLRGAPGDLPGRECVTYCRAVTECDEGSDRLAGDCVTECANGFEGEDGLRFAAAADCLSGLLPGADCRPLRACLPDEVAIDCAAFCDTLDDCRVAPDGCVAACEAEVEVGTAGCVADALRVNRGCARVAECVGFEGPGASEACADLCAARRVCDFELDRFLCELDCPPDDAGTPVRAACAAVTACEDLDACLDGDAPRVDGCADPCDGAVECGAFDDAERCVDVCSGRDLSPRSGADYVAGVAMCLDEAGDVPACTGCFDVAADCEDACGLLVECGFFDPGEPCVPDCEEGNRFDPVENQRVVDCIVDFLRADCDINGLQRCIDGGPGGGGPPPPPPPPPPDDGEP